METRTKGPHGAQTEHILNYTTIHPRTGRRNSIIRSEGLKTGFLILFVRVSVPKTKLKEILQILPLGNVRISLPYKNINMGPELSI